MHILSCRVCGVEFEAKSPARLYCNPDCAESGVARHGVTGYRKGCRCSECKAAQNADVKAYNARVRERDGISAQAKYRRKVRGKHQGVIIDCTVCGKPLKTIRDRGESLPVHKACMAGRSYLRNGFSESIKVRNFRAKIDKAAAGTSGKRVFTAGGCEWCGKHFAAIGGRFCSDGCKKSSKYARRSSGNTFQISPKARQAIYERDSWTCQLCMMPADGSLHHLDRWAPSLDHIIPQSQQLIPDHSPSNLRLVHRWCNSARGDGLNMDEQELVRRAIELLEAA